MAFCPRFSIWISTNKHDLIGYKENLLVYKIWVFKLAYHAFQHEECYEHIFQNHGRSVKEYMDKFLVFVDDFNIHNLTWANHL
jgi:hypothetical protein